MATGAVPGAVSYGAPAGGPVGYGDAVRLGRRTNKGAAGLDLEPLGIFNPGKG